jgi:rhamnulokinase/L-fuculokinase
MSAGAIADIKQARKIIADGENLKLYEPCDRDAWEAAYEKYKEIIG